MAVPASLTLITRTECGLCEDLARDLSKLGVPFSTVDIDDNSELLRLYDECVPVLLQDGIELGRAPFTPADLQKSLKAAGVLR